MAEDMESAIELYLSLPGENSPNQEVNLLIRDCMDRNVTSVVGLALGELGGPAGGGIVDTLSRLLEDRNLAFDAFGALCRLDNPEAHAVAFRALRDSPDRFRFCAARLGPRISREQASELIRLAVRGPYTRVYLSVLSAAPQEVILGQEKELVGVLERELRECRASEYLDFCALEASFANSIGDRSHLAFLEDELERAPEGRARRLLESAIERIRNRIHR
jgi:hypothetical protein